MNNKVPLELLTEAARRVPESGIREIFNRAVDREGILHLEVGEPDFQTPKHIVEAACEAAHRGSRYTQTAGLVEVREAATERLRRVHGLDLDTEQILITQGGAQAVAAIVTATLGPGDEVLIPDPAWPPYSMMALALGATVVPYRLRAEDTWLPDPEEVRSLFTSRSKLLVLNSPTNPTGTVIPASDLEALVKVAQDAGVLVLSDEVYDEIVFDGRSPRSAVNCEPEWVIGVWSCSKTYAMTGWRVGYLAATKTIVATLTRIQEAMIACVSSVSQAAALAAFTGPQGSVIEMRDSYQRRRDLVVNLLDEAGIQVVEPSGAFYLMVPLPGASGSRKAALDLLDQGVAVAPGSAFGQVAEDFVRVSLAAGEETLREGVARLISWYEASGRARP